MTRFHHRYAVSANYELLRFFTSREDADLYARAVIEQSDPNIGIVRLEVFREQCECYVTLRSYGFPQGNMQLDSVPLS